MAVFTARAVPLISAQMHNMTLKNFGMVFDHLLRIVAHQPKRLKGFLGCLTLISLSFTDDVQGCVDFGYINSNLTKLLADFILQLSESVENIVSLL